MCTALCVVALEYRLSRIVIINMGTGASILPFSGGSKRFSNIDISKDCIPFSACIEDPQQQANEERSPSTLTSSSSKWKSKLYYNDARAKYIKDGSLSVNSDVIEVELRSLLDIEEAGQYVDKYYLQHSTRSLNILKCFMAIQEFKLEALDPVERDDVGLNIYNTYIVDSSEATLGAELLSGDEGAYDIRVQKRPFLTSFYDKLSSACFDALMKVFLRFVESEQYIRMCDALDKSYNVVQPADFNHIDIIGKGTVRVYGIVMSGLVINSSL